MIFWQIFESIFTQMTGMLKIIKYLKLDLNSQRYIKYIVHTRVLCNDLAYHIFGYARIEIESLFLREFCISL